DTQKETGYFCIRPWKNLEVRRDGKLDFCCKFPSPLHSGDSTPFRITQHSLDEIWNGVELRGIRRDMLEGLPIRGCEVCYERESAGYPSDRILATGGWREGWLNEGRQTFEQLSAQAKANDYRVPGPAFIQLSAGNLCNLKCRMCNGSASSSVAKDPVHGQWSGTCEYPVQHRWWQDRSVLNKIFQHPQLVRRLQMMGGEPFLIKELGDVLQYLVDLGVAKNIVLEVNTNGSVKKASWLPLVEQFKRLDLPVSIDAFGELNRYIRYPCRWDHLARNMEYFKTLPNTELSTAVVLQAYNALNLVDLFRYFDSAGLPLGYVFPMEHPPYLTTRVLPLKARLLAAQRLRAYARTDCRAENRPIVISLADGLEAQADSFDEDRLVEFMTFTKELDASRGQSFEEVCPELHELIKQSGYEWTGATLRKSQKVLQSRIRALAREAVRQGWRKLSGKRA
ncbi:MAG: twitch domain-containing radical SAM protein, partial [Lysobacterales bacterium]